MIVLRQPTLDDADAIARVHALSWKSAYRGIVPDEFLDAIDVDAWAERHRHTMVEDPRVFVAYVAEEEGEIVGWALGGPNRDTSLEFSSELFTIYLHPDYLRQGIGRKLIAAVAESLADLGFESMLVWVLAENWPARRFYEALGGAYVSRGVMDMDDAALPVVSYGWRDLRVLLEAAR